MPLLLASVPSCEKIPGLRVIVTEEYHSHNVYVAEPGEIDYEGTTDLDTIKVLCQVVSRSLAPGFRHS